MGIEVPAFHFVLLNLPSFWFVFNGLGREFLPGNGEVAGEA